MSDAPPPSRPTAIVFSLIMPGVGHVHAGYAWRGVVLHLVYQAGLLSCLVTLWTSSELLFTGVATMVVLSRAFAVFDVLRRVRASTHRASWGLVFGVGAVLYLIGSGGMRLVRDRVVDAAAMPSTAMAPTLRYGDRFFVDRRVPVEVGDIAVYEGAGVPQVGRVVAQAGQKVTVRGGQVTVDDRDLPRCEVGVAELAPGRRRVWLERIGPRLHFVAEPVEGGRDLEVEVGADEVYLLGDDRAAPAPGAVGVGGIVGPVSQVFWGAEGSTDADVSGEDGVAIPPSIDPLRSALDICRDQLMSTEG